MSVQLREQGSLLRVKLFTRQENRPCYPCELPSLKNGAPSAVVDAPFYLYFSVTIFIPISSGLSIVPIMPSIKKGFDETD